MEKNKMNPNTSRGHSSLSIAHDNALENQNDLSNNNEDDQLFSIDDSFFDLSIVIDIHETSQLLEDRTIENKDTDSDKLIEFVKLGENPAALQRNPNFDFMNSTIEDVYDSVDSDVNICGEIPDLPSDSDDDMDPAKRKRNPSIDDFIDDYKGNADDDSDDDKPSFDSPKFRPKILNNEVNASDTDPSNIDNNCLDMLLNDSGLSIEEDGINISDDNGNDSDNDNNHWQIVNGMYSLTNQNNSTAIDYDIVNGNTRENEIAEDVIIESDLEDDNRVHYNIINYNEEDDLVNGNVAHYNIVDDGIMYDNIVNDNIVNNDYDIVNNNNYNVVNNNNNNTVNNNDIGMINSNGINIVNNSEDISLNNNSRNSSSGVMLSNSNPYDHSSNNNSNNNNNDSNPGNSESRSQANSDQSSSGDIHHDKYNNNNGSNGSPGAGGTAS